jgi:ABC-type hemin transport system ATPase subunit
VFEVIRNLAQRGMTVLMVEHKMEWVAAFADRVIALENGRILAEGAPAEVLTDERLLEHHFGFSRYTLVAREARKEALWPPSRRLPVTLEEAEAGFREGLGRS